jgi:hypothetical protein
LNDAPEEYFQLLANLFGLRFRGKENVPSVADASKLAS